MDKHAVATAKLCREFHDASNTYFGEIMGQAKARRREIAELKRLGVRRIDTPWETSPVLTVMSGAYNGTGTDTWMILNRNFQQELDELHARPLDKSSLEGTVMRLARLALWAERSGVKEVVAQNWYAYQQRVLHDRIRQQQADQRPVVAETRVLASKRKRK